MTLAYHDVDPDVIHMLSIGNEFDVDYRGVLDGDYTIRYRVVRGSWPPGYPATKPAPNAYQVVWKRAESGSTGR